MSFKQNSKRFARFAVTFSRITSKWSWAYYIGGEETVNRLEAQRLKNRDALVKIEEHSNKLLLQDLEIEKRKLEILKLERELGLNAGTFKADEYPEPGNIREENRNK